MRIPIALAATALVLPATLALAAPSYAGTVISEAEVTATIHCAPGNRTVRVDGAEAHLTLTGHCTSLVVSGSEARITAAVVDKISLSGSEGRITYKKASGGGPARVSVTGSESTVRRR